MLKFENQSKEVPYPHKTPSLVVNGHRLATSGPLLAAVKAEESPLTLWCPAGEGGRETGDGNGCWVSEPSILPHSCCTLHAF